MHLLTKREVRIANYRLKADPALIIPEPHPDEDGIRCYHFSPFTSFEAGQFVTFEGALHQIVATGWVIRKDLSEAQVPFYFLKKPGEPKKLIGHVYHSVLTPANEMERLAIESMDEQEFADYMDPPPPEWKEGDLLYVPWVPVVMADFEIPAHFKRRKIKGIPPEFFGKTTIENPEG